MTTETDSAGGGSTTRTYRIPEDETPSEAVIRAVSTFAGRGLLASPDGTEIEPLDPLYDTIDPDALDALFSTAARDVAGTVEFAYCGYEVTVDRAGTVTVSEL